MNTTKRSLAMLVQLVRKLSSRLSLSAGKNTEVKNDRGQTSLHFAVIEAVVETLVEANVNIQAKHHVCQTPLCFINNTTIPKASSRME